MIHIFRFVVCHCISRMSSKSMELFLLPSELVRPLSSFAFRWSFYSSTAYAFEYRWPIYGTSTSSGTGCRRWPDTVRRENKNSFRSSWFFSVSLWFRCESIYRYSFATHSHSPAQIPRCRSSFTEPPLLEFVFFGNNYANGDSLNVFFPTIIFIVITVIRLVRFFARYLPIPVMSESDAGVSGSFPLMRFIFIKRFFSSSLSTTND